MIIEGKNILLGVTGGIAAYKSAVLARLFKRASADVRVIMTESAQKFIAPLTMAALSQNPVGLDMFAQPPIHEVRHIAWAEWADLAVIAPATANCLAKAAAGLGDDLLSTTILSLECPLIIAPAMHRQMWAHPATQRNIETLRNYGYHIIEPGVGELASGDVGAGRMREPEEIFDFITKL